MKTLNHKLICLIAFILAGCATTPKEVAELQTNLPTPNLTVIAQNADGQIRHYDTLQVSVFDAPKLGGDYQVGVDGNVNLPLIGQLKASGLSADRLANDIKYRLGEKYLQNPHVSVIIKNTNKDRITIDGSVTRPGVYPIRGRTTLLQAIALSGGGDEFANLDRVIVFRDIEGVRNAAGFDVEKIRAGLSEDPLVYGDDIIVVDGSESKRNYREVLRAIPLVGLFRIFGVI